MKKTITAIASITASLVLASTVSTAQAAEIKMVCVGKKPIQVYVDTSVPHLLMNGETFYFTKTDKKQTSTMNQFESVQNEIVQIVSDNDFIGFTHYKDGKKYQDGLCYAQQQ